MKKVIIMGDDKGKENGDFVILTKGQISDEELEALLRQKGLIAEGETVMQDEPEDEPEEEPEEEPEAEDDMGEMEGDNPFDDDDEIELPPSVDAAIHEVILKAMELNDTYQHLVRDREFTHVMRDMPTEPSHVMNYCNVMNQMTMLRASVECAITTTEFLDDFIPYIEDEDMLDGLENAMNQLEKLICLIEPWADMLDTKREILFGNGDDDDDEEDDED